MTFQEFTSLLDGVKHQAAGAMARCPAHEDKTASLAISTGDDGRILLKCFASCTPEEITEAMGLSMADLFPDSGNGKPKNHPEIVAEYDYRDAEGALLYQVVRYVPKDFRQRRPNGEGGWLWNLQGVKRVLFMLPELVEAVEAGRLICIPEGEKDVLTLVGHGLDATCNAGGAGKWRPEYSEALQGARVAVLPDNDQPGIKSAKQIATALSGIAAEVKLIELHGLPPKGDVTDWFSIKGNTAEKLTAIIEADVFTPALAKDTGTAPEIVTISDVVPEKVSWLWPGRIPRGKLTVLDGDPGLGKSTITLDLGACISMGRPLPDSHESREPEGVVVLSAEDGLADTIRPRLEAAGADLSKVAAIKGILDGGEHRPLGIPGDVTHIETAITKVNAALVIIDPLMAFLSGTVNSHRDQDIRRALHTLSDLAERTGAAILIIRHLNKAPGASPLYRGGGSIGIIGAARSGLVVGKDPEDESRRVLAVTKSNLGAEPPSLAYTIENDPLFNVSRIRWHGVVNLSANQILPTGDGGQDTGALAEAKAVLKDILAQGPMPSRWVKKQAKEAGIADRTLDRAKQVLGVRSDKSGGIGGADSCWKWSLPEVRQPTPKPDSWRTWRTSENIDVSGQNGDEDHEERQTHELGVLGDSTTDFEV